MPILSKTNILINQKPLKTFQQITINQNLYGIDKFEIICRYEALEELDGFLIEKSKNLLGLPVVIQTKSLTNDEEKDGLNFTGYVSEIQSSRSSMSDTDQVIISGGSKEIILNRKATNRAFIDSTLDDIVREVLKDYDLRSKPNARNKERFPYIVQFEESDLEFLKRLAIRYGEWFFFNGSEIIFGEIPEVERLLTIGNNLHDFRYELRVAPVNFSLFTLDPLKISVYRYQSGKSKIESNLNIYGKHALDMSKKVYSLEGKDYYEHINSDEKAYQKSLDLVGELQESADSVNLTDISGSSSNGLLTAGSYAKISCLKQDGKSKMDYGKYLITSVLHRIDNTLTYQNSFSAIPAETSVPENSDPYLVRTSSNQLAMVEDNNDPKQLGRIKVSFWWMEGKQSTSWIKVVTPFTHKNAGIYFVPTVNARVLVGFEDGDVEKPYCLGCLYDEDACPDPAWTGNANQKNAKIHAIRTFSGNTIEFHDSEGGEKITIYDKGDKNRITLDSANGTLTIHADGTLNLNASNINIEAEKKIKIICEDQEANITNDEKTTVGNKKDLQVGSDLGITAGGDATITAGKKAKTEGADVELSAMGSLKSKAMGTAELSAAGNTVIKGAIVQIN